MKTLMRTSAAAALVLAGALLLGPMSVSASSGEHWGPSFGSDTNDTWEDHHGQEVTITVNWFLWQNQTITSANGSHWHAAASVCLINGVPSYIDHGLWQPGSTWSVSTCEPGDVVFAGAPRTWW